MDAALKDRIDQIVKSKPVVIFMKGTPQFPQCGFSGKAVSLLQQAGVKPDQLGWFDVFSDDTIREGVKQYSNWPTLPQVFIKGEFVGGSDILAELAQSGELQKLL